MNRIVISGWYGYKNLGDEVILNCMSEEIRNSLENTSITAMSFDPGYTEQQGINAVRHLPFTFKGIVALFVKGRIPAFFKTIRAIKNADLILIGGGGFLSDWNPIAIKPWLWQIYLYKKVFKKKVMIYAIGAGPFIHPHYMNRVKDTLKYVDVITVRDEESNQQLKKCGIDNAVVTTDPVVSLSLPSEYKTVSSSKRRIGISIAPLFISGLWKDSRNKYNNYLQAIVELINKINDHYKNELEIIFIPMEDEYDYNFNQEIVGKLNDASNVSIVNKGKTINEKLEIMNTIDLMIGMRLHSIIISSTLGIPSLGIVYHHKVYEFLRSVGLEGLSVGVGDGDNWADIDLDSESLFRNFKELYDNLDDYSQNVANAVAKLKIKNKENTKYVRQLIGRDAP